MLKRRCVLKGFTLIELLVVIAVLALLLSIIMPSLAKAKEFARRTVCLSHQGQLGLICVTYAQDNDDWFPDYNVHPGPNVVSNQSTDTRIVFDGWNGDARSVWVGYVADYTMEKSTDVFYCPSENIIVLENVWPTHPVGGSYFTGYGYWGNWAYYDPPDAQVWGSILDPAQKTTTVKTSALVPLFCDWVQYASGQVAGKPWDVTHSTSGRSRGYMAAEALGMNSTYADGSAHWCNYKSEEFSAALQGSPTAIRFWGAPRTLEKDGYGLQ